MITETLGYILGAWLLADFLSGLFHWIEDRYLTEDMPFLGKHVAIPNERHHQDPTEFIENNSYFNRNWTTMASAGFVALVVALLGWRLGIDTTWTLLALAFVSQANEVHAYAHRKSVSLPWWVAMLQEMGVFQTKKMHSQHHSKEHDTAYCVMSNFLNPVLDRIKFWLWLEWLVRRIGFKIKELRDA